MCFDKIFRFLVMGGCLVGGSMGSLSFATNDYCNQGDLMQQAYCMAKYRDTYIDLWNTSKAVGNSFIRGSLSIDLFAGVDLGSLSKRQQQQIKDKVSDVKIYLWRIEAEKWGDDIEEEDKITALEVEKIKQLLKEIKEMGGRIGKGAAKDLQDSVDYLSGKIDELGGQWSASVIGGLISDITWSGGDFIALKKNDSLVIRITRFILMLTVVLAVTMVIINGIQYITKSANGEDPSKTRWNLFYLVIGLLLALFSVVIINLFRSIGETTLDGIGDSSTYIQKQDTLPLA